MCLRRSPTGISLSFTGNGGTTIALRIAARLVLCRPRRARGSRSAPRSLCDTAGKDFAAAQGWGLGEFATMREGNPCAGAHGMRVYELAAMREGRNPCAGAHVMV